MEITKIHVQNFMSLAEVEYDFQQQTLVEIVGRNTDVLDSTTKLPSSNGTGKSAFTLAIYQGLFNRNPKVPKIDLLKNSVTGKHYTIDLWVNNNGHVYTIHNDRTTNKIVVTKDGVVVTSKIAESLKFIQDEVIGLGYDEFVALTYISNKNILSIFDTTSSSMVTKFFNFDILTSYYKKLTSKRTELNTTIRTLSNLIVSKPVTIIEDVTELQVQLRLKGAELKELEIKASKLRQYKDIVHDMNTIAKELKANEDGICPTCKRALDSKLNSDLDNDALVAELTYYEEVQSELTKTMSTISDLKRRIALSSKVEDKVAENTANVKADIEHHKIKLDKVNRAIAIIKTGKVQDVVLRDFIRTLNYNIGILNNSGHVIRATLSNGSITYTVITKGVTKDATTLSSGELTSVGLHIVSALLYTLSKLLGVSINLLILDEAINAVDETNANVVSKLLSTLKTKVGKTILLTQHHNEISDEYIDTRLILIKSDGCTKRVAHDT